MEAFRTANGSYPLSISLVLEAGDEVPPVLQGTTWYESDGNAYYFQVFTPEGRFNWIAVRFFSSKTGVWATSGG